MQHLVAVMIVITTTTRCNHSLFHGLIYIYIVIYIFIYTYIYLKLNKRTIKQKIIIKKSTTSCGIYLYIRCIWFFYRVTLLYTHTHMYIPYSIHIYIIWFECFSAHTHLLNGFLSFSWSISIYFFSFFEYRYAIFVSIFFS